MKCQTLSSEDAIYETVKPSFLGRIKIICHSVEFAERRLTVNSHTKTLFLHVSKTECLYQPFSTVIEKNKTKKTTTKFLFQKKKIPRKLQNFWPVRHLKGFSNSSFFML